MINDIVPQQSQIDNVERSRIDADVGCHYQHRRHTRSCSQNNLVQKFEHFKVLAP